MERKPYRKGRRTMRKLYRLGMLTILLSLVASPVFAGNEPLCEPLKEGASKGLYGLCIAYHNAGNSNARTPNLDKLAANGVMFRNNFVNNPVCLPSRISMFSGLYPSQTGVLNNKHKGEWLTFKGSLPWYFKQAGYRTGYIGKNHTYIDAELDNFDVTSIRGREECRAYSKYVPPNWHSDIFWPEKDCNPGKNTREAIAFINESNPGTPFFLHVSYFDPHPPYMAPSKY